MPNDVEIRRYQRIDVISILIRRVVSVGHDKNNRELYDIRRNLVLVLIQNHGSFNFTF